MGGARASRAVLCAPAQDSELCPHDAASLRETTCAKRRPARARDAARGERALPISFSEHHGRLNRKRSNIPRLGRRFTHRVSHPGYFAGGKKRSITGWMASAQIWYPLAFGWRKSGMTEGLKVPSGSRNLSPKSR